MITFQGSYWGDHDWKAGDSEDAVARKAYEALLRVSLLQPTSDKFQDFADKVKQRSLEYYNYTISEGEEVHKYKINKQKFKHLIICVVTVLT